MLSCTNKNDVQNLLKAGRNINERDHMGNNIVHKAVIKKDLELLKYVLDIGASARIKNIKGETPVFYADENTLKVLLDKVGPIIFTDFNNLGKNYHSRHQ